MMHLYQAFGKAEDAWQAALVAKFGKRAGDVRYTVEGHTGEFAGLYEAFSLAGCEWRNHPSNSLTKGCNCSTDHGYRPRAGVA